MGCHSCHHPVFGLSVFRKFIDRCHMLDARIIYQNVGGAQLFGAIGNHRPDFIGLINNAGIQHVAPVDEFPEDKWDAILAIILSSAFHTTKAALPGMKSKGWGRVINTGSMHSLVASPYKSAYNAAKHGLSGFTKTVALEVATQGITVNCICPGYVWTPLVEGQIPDTMKTRNLTREQVINDVLLANQPQKQFVQASRQRKRARAAS